jgi:hypothetical protein
MIPPRHSPSTSGRSRPATLTCPRASLALSRLLKKNGELGGAKAAWRRVIDSPDAQSAGPAFTDLVNLLRDDDDIDGPRAAYQAGTEQHNPDAL